jgi:hypothetical protein
MMYGLLIGLILASALIIWLNRNIIKDCNTTTMTDRSYRHVMATTRYREISSDICRIILITSMGALIGLIIRGS